MMRRPPPDTEADVVALSSDGNHAKKWVTVGTAKWVTDDSPKKPPVLSVTIHGEPYSWKDGSSPRELRCRPPRRRLGAPLSRLPRELAAWVAARPPAQLPAAAAFLRSKGFNVEADELEQRAPAQPSTSLNPPMTSQHRRKTP
jgi:hypothetical protein